PIPRKSKKTRRARLAPPPDGGVLLIVASEIHGRSAALPHEPLRCLIFASSRSNRDAGGCPPAPRLPRQNPVSRPAFDVEALHFFSTAPHPEHRACCHRQGSKPAGSLPSHRIAGLRAAFERRCGPALFDFARAG